MIAALSSMHVYFLACFGVFSFTGEVNMIQITFKKLSILSKYLFLLFAHEFFHFRSLQLGFHFQRSPFLGAFFIVFVYAINRQLKQTLHLYMQTL